MHMCAQVWYSCIYICRYVYLPKMCTHACTSIYIRLEHMHVCHRYECACAHVWVHEVGADTKAEGLGFTTLLSAIGPGKGQGHVKRAVPS